MKRAAAKILVVVSRMPEYYAVSLDMPILFLCNKVIIMEQIKRST